MSVKIFACLNPVSNKRTIFETNPGSVKDIITSLNTGFPLTHARVCRNGEIIKDFTVEAKDGDTLWIKFVPSGTNEEIGTGMKIGGWALVALGIAACFIPGVGGFIGSALIGTGLSTALGGTVLLNTNIPSMGDSEKPEQDPSVRGAKNQSRPLARIPVLFGCHRIHPDLAANQYTEIKGDRQYLIQLFCGGYNDCVIDRNSFKLGDIPIVDLSQTGDIQQILAGVDTAIDVEIMQKGEASTIYPVCVHEEVLNAPLQKEIKDADGKKIPGEIIRTTPDNTDEINLDIFFQNGLGKYNDQGKIGSASVEVRAWYKGSGDSDYTLLGFFNGNSNVVSGAELKLRRFQIKKEKLPKDKYSVKIERVTADSTDSKVVDMVHVGSIRSKKSERPIRRAIQKELTIIALKVMATSKLNGIIDSFNYVATSKLPVYSKKGSGPLYWLNAEETSNPASMLLYALRGRAAQQRVDPNDIDWPSIEEFYTWCEEHDYTCNAYLSQAVTIAEMIRMIGSTSRADILRIDSKISVVQDIERPALMQLFTPKNTASYSVTMFNADIPDAIALRFIDKNAGFAHNESHVYNTPDGNKTEEPDSIQRVDLWGVTDDRQARRIGMYNYACLKNRPFVHTIETDFEYLLVNKGDWIQYAGDVALTGAVQGRIKGIIMIDDHVVGIDTDEPVVMTEGKIYAVRIRLKDGTIILKEVVFSPGLQREKSVPYYPGEGEELFEPFIGEMYAIDEDSNLYYEPQNMLLFTEPMEAENAPRAGNIYAFGVRGYEVIDLIITDIQPGQNLSAALTCVEYSPEIFDVDKPGFILPEFENKITPVTGAVDHGVINPDNWKHFAVFHDSEEEPARPSGDGQDGDWYREQNFRSIWQSAKTAKSVEDGEWGLPVRIRAERGTDDITPVWLGLTPQNVTLETDGDGNILAGLLPLEIQARLFQWNSVLSDVLYSLTGAPEGITIDANGLVTVGKNAVLGENNIVTVNASYQGTVYSSAFSIKKNIRNSPAKYLGTIKAIPSDATVFIITGPVQGQVRALQGDYVLAVEAVGDEKAGSVFQWTGTAWVYRDPVQFTDLYTRCFMDGLNEPGLADDVQWVGALFAARIAAAKAFIAELEAQIIKVTGLIYGGDRFNIEGDVIDATKPGWWLGPDGTFKAANGIFDGKVFANEGTFENGIFTKIRVQGDSFFSGNIDTDVFQVMPSKTTRFDTSGYSVSGFITKVKTDLSIPSTVQEVTLFPVSSSAHPSFGSSIIKVRFVSLRVTITYANGTEIAFTGSSFSFNFSFTVGTTGRAIKMPNLPSDVGVPPDTLYKFYNQALGVTLLAIK